MWISSMFVFTSCPRTFIGFTLVIAFITLVKVLQRSSPAFFHIPAPFVFRVDIWKVS